MTPRYGTQLARSLVGLVILLAICSSERVWGQAIASPPEASPAEPSHDSGVSNPSAQDGDKDEVGDDEGDAAPVARQSPGENGSAADLLKPPLVESEEYFELLKLFADTLDQVERNYVEQVSRRELLEAAIQGVLAKLDQYSDYIPPEQFDNFRTGVENEFGGIGIRVGMIDGQLTVITPLYGTPAYQAGVLAGDKILRIDTTSSERLTSLEDAIKKMKGPIGSELEIRVKHADGVEEQLTVKRELVQIETVVGDHRRSDDRWQFMFDEEKKIGYVRIKSFSSQTAEDLRKAMQELTEQGLEALILDVRFNPGGMLTSAIEVSDTFLERGKIVSTIGRNVPDRSWSASEAGTFSGFKMAVLVNRYSASASEIVSAALQDHDRAIVIGERTWGKGSVQNIIELEGGRSALKLTTASYMRPNGKNIHREQDATESDDWGVIPNEGFLLRMSTDEMRRLVTYQGDRDILLSASAKKERGREVYIDRHIQAAIDYFTKP